MNNQERQAKVRPLWRRFALDEPAEAETTEAGPDIDALDAVAEPHDAPEQREPRPSGLARRWARLALALDVARHARAWSRRSGSNG